MARLKIAVIGGGSTYTPELVSGLSRENDRIGIRELVLHDIDPERREVVGGLAARMLERQGFDGTLEVTGELDRALDGADFVLVQIRVGGQAARLSDETVPLACGCIGQETTGAGGLAKALRTVPVVLELAERVRELAAPDAWIVDFTNPVGIVTRSLLDAGHRAVGLCNVAIGFQRSFAKHLGLEPHEVVVDQVGLNHLTWVRAVHVDGRDVLPELLAAHGEAIAEQAALPLRLLEELGVVPSPYLQYFYRHDAILAEQLDGVPRAAVVAEIERGLLELYRDPALNEKPACSSSAAEPSTARPRPGSSPRSSAATAPCTRWTCATTARSPGWRTTTSSRFRRGSSTGVSSPLPQAPLAPELLGLAQHVAAYERLAARAAVTADPADARKALLAHPLVGQHPLNEDLVERLLEAEASERTALA